MCSVDYSEYKSIGNAEVVKRWWVILLVHNNHNSHTKIEKTADIARYLGTKDAWRVAVVAAVPNITTAEKFVEYFLNATIRGSLSRSVVFEQIAVELGLTVYSDMTVIFKQTNAEQLVARQPFINTM